MILPALFFLKIVLAILGLLYFHPNFRMICSSSVKNVIGILIGITFNLQILLRSLVFLIILSILMSMSIVYLSICLCHH